MSTVGQVVDRVLRDALYGPDDQPVVAVLAASITDSATTVTYTTGDLTPDEEGALTVGVLIEIGSEQMRVRDFTESGSLVVARGANGTTAAAHTAGAEIIVAPTWSRKTVFDAVADAVPRLHPHLWRQAYTSVSVAWPYAELPSTLDSIVQVRYTTGRVAYQVGHELLTGLDADGTKGLITYDVGEGQSVDVVYRAGFERPDSEDDDLADLGVRAEWERILIVDAVASLLSGSIEVGRATQNWLTEELSAQSYQPLTAARLAAQMDQYRQSLLRDAARSLRARDRRGIRRRNPFGMVASW